tara:strand:- start:123 stop:2387 length:2265 start_codon:yes stop_codon:yes gene_type:complete
MNVQLHGVLAESFGKDFYFCVDTIGDAIRAIQANTGSFYDFLRKKDREGLCYKVIVGQDPNGEPIGCDELSTKRGLSGETLHIIPVAQGAENLQAILNIIIGIMLIVAGIFIPGAQWLIVAGALMVMGGIMQLITKPPEPPAPGRRPTSVSTTSFAFSGPVNIMKQGSPVWLGYGRLKVGANVLSTAYRSTGYFSEYDVGGVSVRTGTDKKGNPIYSTEEKKSNFLPSPGDASYCVPINWVEKSPKYGNISKEMPADEVGNTTDESASPKTPPAGPLIFPTWNAYLTGLGSMFNIKEINNQLYFVDADGNTVHKNLLLPSNPSESDKQAAIEKWLETRGFSAAGNKLPIYDSSTPLLLSREKVSREGPADSEFAPRYPKVSYSKSSSTSGAGVEFETVNTIGINWTKPSSNAKEVVGYKVKAWPSLQFQFAIVYNKGSSSPAARKIYESTPSGSDGSKYFELDFVQNQLDYPDLMIHSATAVRAGEKHALHGKALTPSDIMQLSDKTELEIGLAFDQFYNYTSLTKVVADFTVFKNTVAAAGFGNVDYKTYDSPVNSLEFGANTQPVNWLKLNPSITLGSPTAPYENVPVYFWGDNSGNAAEYDYIVSKQLGNLNAEDKSLAEDKGSNSFASGYEFFLIPIPATLPTGRPKSKEVYRPKEYEVFSEVDSGGKKLFEYNILDDSMSKSQLLIEDDTKTLNFKIFMDPVFMLKFTVTALLSDGTESPAAEGNADGETLIFTDKSQKDFNLNANFSD